MDWQTENSIGTICFFSCMTLCIACFASCSAVECYSKNKALESTQKALIEKGNIPLEININGTVLKWGKPEQTKEVKETEKAEETE